MLELFMEGFVQMGYSEVTVHSVTMVCGVYNRNAIEICGANHTNIKENPALIG